MYGQSFKYQSKCVSTLHFIYILFSFQVIKYDYFAIHRFRRCCQCNWSNINNIIMRVRYNINNNNTYYSITIMYIKRSRATVSRSPRPLSYYETEFNNAWDIILLLRYTR